MTSPAASTVDPTLLTHAERIALLERLACEEGAIAALRARTLAAVEAADRSEKHWDREEVAAVLRLASATVRTQLAQATRLVTELPATLDMLQSAQIGWGHVRVLLDATVGLEPAVVAAVEAHALRRIADGRARTAAQFRPVVTRAVARVDVRGFEDRYAEAVAQRRVTSRANTADATTDVHALALPADEAARLLAALDAAARAAAVLPDGTPDPRTADQRRADALLDLAHGSDAARTDRPSVSVLVAASTLLGLDELPAWLDGHGPIPASTARAIAEDPAGVWRRILTDPGGDPLGVSPSYRPPAAMRGLVALRDRTCRFPGCRRRAVSCDVDHVVDHAHGGPTTMDNLHTLCARHHHLKHEGGWQVQRLADGVTRWRTPTGRVIDVPPDPYDDVAPDWLPHRAPDTDSVAPVGGYDPDPPRHLIEPADLDERECQAA